MILSELKQYIKNRQQVSLTDIANHFDVEPEAVRGMLQFWINKGKINQQLSGPGCGGGCHCDYKGSNEIYEWNPELHNISIEIR
jgi:hypothetical protein